MKSLNYYFSQQISNKLKIIFSLIASILFFILGVFYYAADHETFAALLFFSIIFFLFSFLFNNLIKNQLLVDFVVIELLMVASILVRINFLDSTSMDYLKFLESWVLELKNNGGFSAIKESSSNYNVFYLYYLAFISYFDISSLYAIKFLSILFDYILALYVAKLLLDIVKLSSEKVILSFFLILFSPTVIINGSLWAQCDSIYVSFGVMCLYYGVLNKPNLSMICFALCFTSKLQAIFLLPIFGVLYVREKIMIKHFITFFVSLFITILPAILLGTSITKILSVYTNQVTRYTSMLTFNAPNVFTFFGKDNEETFTTFKSIGNAGIMITFFIVLFILYLVFLKQKFLDDKATIGLAFLFVTVIPYFLPYMHERYFYFSVIFAVIFIFVFPKYYFIVILTEISSFFSSIFFIIRGKNILTLASLAILMFCVILVSGTLIYKKLNGEESPTIWR